MLYRNSSEGRFASGFGFTLPGWLSLGLLALLPACFTGYFIFTIRRRRQSRGITNLTGMEGRLDRTGEPVRDLEPARIEAIQTKAELALANERLNRILDSTEDRVIAIGWDWKIMYANRNMRRLRPTLQVGADFWEVFPQDVSPQAPIHLRKAMEQRLEAAYDTYYSPTDDWLKVRVYPTDDGITAFLTSISAHKRLEQELETERTAVLTRLNTVLDATSDGVLSVAADWTVLYGNRRALQVLPDLVIGRSLWACFPALAGTHVEEHLRHSMQDRVELKYESYYEPYAEWFETNAYPASAGISIFFRLITERKELERQLEKERSLRDERIVAMSNMAGGLAHEISNPLAIIHGTAMDLMHLSVDDSEAALAAMHLASKSIVQTSDRAMRILRGLRGFTREAGNDPKENASIYDIVDQAVQLQEGRLRGHDIDLQVLLPPGLPIVFCRETQIGQILTNLLNNAADAIMAPYPEADQQQERWIVMEASTTNGLLHVDVTDSGHGVDEETRKHLMEPFFTTKTGGLGMGVGLSLSRAIAIEHGGSLSLLEGKVHTCFRLTIPVSQPPDVETGSSGESF